MGVPMVPDFSMLVSAVLTASSILAVGSLFIFV